MSIATNALHLANDARISGARATSPYHTRDTARGIHTCGTRLPSPLCPLEVSRAEFHVEEQPEPIFNGYVYQTVLARSG